MAKQTRRSVHSFVRVCEIRHARQAIAVSRNLPEVGHFNEISLQYVGIFCYFCIKYMTKI